MERSSAVIDVAVVIPAYRAASTLPQALAGVLGQTTPPSEIIVVVDSLDDRASVEAAEAFHAALPLTVLVQANAGPAAARRHAINHATAARIALLDADDVWLPDHLDILDRLHREKGGVVCADALDWRPGATLGLRPRSSRFPVPPKPQQRAGILRSNFVFIGALFERALYEAVGGFRDGFTGAEDWDLWIRLVREGALITGADTPTVLYRISDSSLTRQPVVYERYCDVLRAARAGCTGDEERQLLESEVRRISARGALARAHCEGASGARRQARREARAALGGPPRVAAEAFAVMAAPRTMTRVGNWLRDRSS